MADENIVDFPGSDMDVRFDQSLCIGIAECGRATGDLFLKGRDPWCLPDASTPAEVRDIITRCPSGALTYTDHHGGSEQPPTDNRMTVVSDGPLYATGDLHIEGAPADKPGLKTRAALCRCGKSQNKPFCDNSHRESNFRDYGAVGDQGPGLETRGGPLELKAVEHGPLLVRGHVEIRAASGRIAWAGEKVALCRCGASENKPFCDGKHREIGW